MEEVRTIDASQGTAVSSWIRDQAIPLTTVEAEHGFTDLEPLKTVLAGVTVVGLGEATHGTREFFQCKHRLIEFLVREMGFTVFVIEASYAACLKINEYVLYGQNDPGEALAGQGFWTWDTEEVTAMIEWMRRYNLTQPEEKKIRFYGNDVQHVHLAFDVVRDYMAGVAPDQTDKIQGILAPVKETQRNARSSVGSDDPLKKGESLENLRRLIGWLGMHRTRLVRQTSATEYENALQHARVLAQFQECYGKPVDMRTMSRDLYMAENTEYIAKQLAPGAKIVVWAHNGHIHKECAEYNGIAVRFQGHYMAEIFGPAYYAFGFAFNQGSFQSRSMFENLDTAKIESFVAGPLTEFAVGPAPVGYVDWYLAGARSGDYIIDLRGAPAKAEVQTWLSTKRRTWSMGSVFSPNWPEDSRTQVSAPNVFDGIIFIERTTRARPTPTGVR